MMRYRREERLADVLFTFFPGATRLITRYNLVFDRSAWVHCLRQWKAAAFSCLSLEQGVISDGTRTTRSSPARGKALTRGRSVLCIDCAYYDALSYATRQLYEKVPLFAISIRKTRCGSETRPSSSVVLKPPNERLSTQGMTRESSQVVHVQSSTD